MDTHANAAAPGLFDDQAGPPVLIPIDVQRGFDFPPWPRRGNPEMEARGLALLAAWRTAGWPILHVRHDSIEPGSTLAPAHAGNAFRPGFEPREGEPVVAKTVNCAFVGTDLELRLRRLGATAVVLFGISTDMCVSTTARIASNLGFRTLLAGDACAAFDLPDGQGGTLPAEEVQRVHLATLGFEFATVLPAAALAAAAKEAAARAAQPTA
ncbi:Nicotinamidase-related amidase [Tistlia consotensis]|uniref:Nicotinamidase-related amidase n=1 Tax=Tistlia consotensis USBA 355 TaxID=560819 RepID=A0A1Y6CHI8_9PROT|nr:cysteine hydrolase family protein [Tistlia consotensis]SMF64574.1 Nicotinamidase-related amidase [Tistlia consotensis USBA 355]SNR97318.1 Nicotinamidase-related amidase [Tistlia consotensis]